VPNGTIIQGTNYKAGILFSSPSGALKSCSPSGADLITNQNASGMTDLFPRPFKVGIKPFTRSFKGGIELSNIEISFWVQSQPIN